MTIGEAMQGLPTIVFEAVLKIVGTGELSDLQKFDELKKILVPFRTELEQVGLVPEYMAYCIVFPQVVERIRLTEEIQSFPA